MNALLDTHAILFAWISPQELSAKARRFIENPENDLYLSQISTLEICLKHRIGKLTLPEPPNIYIPSRIQRFGIRYVPLEDDDIFRMDDLPIAHRDPFDWLLITTAQRLKLPIISRDRAWGSYPIQQIW